ncbi:hypothetical protein NYF23_06720 [SAR92 clade bacterium H455]|uniref:LysR family transcriptional regulator n=1 Tax=SAR92 clade bacterium H455 TaxID=2974818 RepID=A0ABY5TR34_9GAMM|nr:hypothetical protein NYF23_06720 [SAR92 clade bacterium H455]
MRSHQANSTEFLRISVMLSFGERRLLPFLEELKILYPDIILDVSLSDE